MDQNVDDYSRIPFDFNELVQFVLRNGLSVFLGFLTDSLKSASFDEKKCNFFEELFQNVPPRLWLFARAIAMQLLSLGYGRRELHPFQIPQMDANLAAIRGVLRSRWTSRLNELAYFELKPLLQRFDAGPLSLQELSRIAIRRAVGGVDFARRVESKAFKERLPPALFVYVSDPTELMFTLDEIDRLIINI